MAVKIEGIKKEINDLSEEEFYELFHYMVELSKKEDNVEFKELDESEISSEIRESVEEAKNTPKDLLYNL